MSTPSRVPRVVSDPTYYIKWVLVLLFIGAGLYLIGPFYEMFMGTGNGALRLVAETGLVVKIFGAIYLLSGSSLAIGMIKNNTTWQRWGLYSMYIILFFTNLMQVLTYGFRPITWLAPMCLAIISMLLWIRERWIFNNA